MLMLIGLGLEGNGISHKGLELIKKAKKVYAEFYTSIPGISINEIEQIIGKGIIELSRKEVEEKEVPLAEAKEMHIAFLVMGDPLVATTHLSLVERARERGIEVSICHAASVYSAIGTTGLMLYKFGKSASIVYPEKNYFPKSFYDAVTENHAIGLHTLLFLDLKADECIYMNPIDGINILKSADKKNIAKDIIVASRIGWKDEKIVYGKAAKLASLPKEYFGPPPHCLIVPGKLHFTEEEYLLHFLYR
ncbi:MAG: diphthine synthase [Candidatus Methanofastidiosia archaeon]